mgnify:CR=1 FL=1|tara:strand:- start:281 stop:643 length:363 start_codon:yes stop_codon:yes gene_type:complete
MQPLIQFFSYSRCSSCRKAKLWLDENQIIYQLIDIIKSPPSKELIAKAIIQYGDKKFLANTSGISYRELGPKTYSEMDNRKAIECLFADPKLLKRPFLFNTNNRIIVGFNSAKWKDFFFN